MGRRVKKKEKYLQGGDAMCVAISLVKLEWHQKYHQKVSIFFAFMVFKDLGFIFWFFGVFCFGVCLCARTCARAHTYMGTYYIQNL